MFHGGSLPALGLDWIFVWVWFNLWAHGIEGRTHLVCAPSQTHFVEDSGSLLFFSLRCALKKSGKENQDTFFFFLILLNCQSVIFCLKVQCVKIQAVSSKGPWCVLKENRDIVQNVTVGFTYCSTGC